MKKLFIFLCSAGLLAIGGCSGNNDRDGNCQITVFTAPAAAIVRAVAGEHFNVSVIVPPGKDAHEYEPTPGDMAAIQRGGAYFSLNSQAEQRLADTVAKSGGAIFYMDENLPGRLPEGGQADGHHGENRDPHLWMSPKNCIIMADNCAGFLAQIQPENRDSFYANRDDFVRKMNEINENLQRRFEPYKGRKFYVFHPAFGYFADAFGICQRAIESGGKTPTPRELESTLADAAKDGVKTLYASEEFNMDMQNAAANFLNCRLVILNPLPEDPAANFMVMADTIIEGFRLEDEL